jgi:surfeit locus 1 family protein
VLTPLKLDDGRAVLVDRGFVPFGTARRDQAPPIAVGGETRSIKGRMDALPRPAVELPGVATGAWPRVVSFPRMAEVAAALDVTLHPQVLLLDPAAPDGFVRDWRPPGIAPDQHLGYAVQWFGLAATLAAIWLVLSFPKRQDAA